MALSVVRGKVWKFGDNISTDLLMPGFSHDIISHQERAAYCMRAERPEFAGEVRSGDVIVAGRNFGCGSGRPAARNLMTLGVGAVIAESFGRLFFRNSVSSGFPVLYCPGVMAAFGEGDVLEADFRTGEVKNLTSGEALRAEPLPDIALRILEAGGVIALLKAEYGEKAR
ncbi:MAG: 3-isopropylmalate dehydratase [Chloroflexi bacterium]|nr:3-isopropylmalate dehydratase [Chloroflexota bacterium]